MQRYWMLLTLFILAEPAFSDTAGCSAVVDDTVAELRAGSTDGWTAEAESLVRRAAGAACVKAQSGRYAEMVEETVTAPESAAAASAEPEEQAEGDENDGSFEAGGITFRPLSGSPSKKSYERSRGDDD